MPPLLNFWKWEGFIKYFGQVLSLLGKSNCGFFTTDFLLRIFCDEFWSHFQLKKIVQCECVQFHLPCYKQPSLFISKTSKAWIVENSPFLLVAMYVHTYNYSHICDTVYTMSTTISRTPHFCPKTMRHFCRLHHWKSVENMIKHMKVSTTHLIFYYFQSYEIKSPP